MPKEMEKSWKILVLATIILNVQADPRCQGSENIVCTGGPKDYILQKGLVSDNRETINVTLSGCRITDIGYESFAKMPNLRYIDLSRNKLKTLKVGTLDEPNEITYFNVSYNQLTAVPIGIFDQISKIQILDLQGNKINNISFVLLEPLTDLIHLDLSYNAFEGKNLNVGMFDQNHLITFINFSGNDMTGVSDNFLSALKNLESLYLNKCNLDTVLGFVTQPSMQTLKYLFLSGNKLSKIDEEATFVYFDNLIKLDLSDNVIEILHENVFQPLKNLRVIILRNNKLKIISENLFQNLPKLGTLVMSHNVLELIPVNAFKGSSLKTLILSYNRLTYLQDNFCLELKNSGATMEKFLFNDNPWQCGCLRDVLKEVKKFKIEYDDAKYKGKKLVCATTLEFNCKRQEILNKFYMDIYDNVIISS